MARQSKPGIGIHGPDKIQDHSNSSSNTHGREEKKQTNKKKQPRPCKNKAKTIISNSFASIICIYATYMLVTHVLN